MTVVELMLVVAIAGAIAAVGLPAYTGYQDRMKLVEVRKDFAIIEMRVERYFVANGKFPPNLEAIAMNQDDPWGNPYQYLNSSTLQGNGQKRKKTGDVPINDDFDLYSMGPNGSSQSPLTAVDSRDDIVRGDNGSFIGWAADY